jgi:hypothetical protein
VPPIAAAIAVVSTWITTAIVTATGVSLLTAAVINTVITFALRTLVVLAVSAAITSLTGKPKNRTGDINQGAELKLKLDPTMPRQIVVGKNATGGSVVWTHTDTPTGSKVPNERLKRVVALSDYPCQALLRVTKGTEELAFDGPFVSGSRIGCTSHFLNKSGVKKFYLTWYDGNQTTADANMIANTSGLWTTNHIGRGISYVILEMLFDPDAYTSGEPELVYELQGVACYDDRHDGSKPARTGSQRLNDPSTWVWTDNAAVITAQLLRGWRHPYNQNVLLYGVQAEERDLEDSMLLSAYNTCDQVVDRADASTEARYRANYIFSTNEPHITALQDLQAAMDGRIIDRGGAITILPGATHTPVMNLTDDSMVWTEQKSWQPKASLEELVNYITGTFVDGEGGTYAEKAFPTLSNSSWESDDGGERFTMQLSFRAVHSWGQIQRITKREFNATRQQGTAAFVLPIEALQMEQGDWCTLTSERWGFTDKYFEVQKIIITQDLKCGVIIRETDPDNDIWDAAIDEKPRHDTTWNPSVPGMPIPEFILTPFTIEQGDIKIPSILFYQESVLYAQESMFIEVEVAQTVDLLSATKIPLIPAAEGTTVLPGSYLPDTSYSVRARTVSGGRVSDWSDWEEVTTDVDFIINLLTGLGDLATLDQVDWATQVTGVHKPEDDATQSHVFRQISTPTATGVNDIWVKLNISSVPIEVYAWNGTAWIKGADITSFNVAIGITGQGPLATSLLTEADVYNALWKLPSVNLFRKVDWTFDGSAAATSSPGFGRSGYGWTLAGGAVSSRVYSTRSGFGVSTGDPYSPSFRAKINTGTATVRIGWRTPGGATISDVPDKLVTVTTADTEYYYDNVQSADSNFATARFQIFTNSGDIASGRTVTITDLMMEHANGHTQDWRPSPDDVDLLRLATYVGELNADATASHVAAGITGQGTLATQNTATWSTQVTGTGKPADFSTRNVIFQQTSTPTANSTGDLWFKTDSREIYRWSGSAWIKDGDLTSQWTAAAITGQGAWATASVPGGLTPTQVNGRTQYFDAGSGMLLDFRGVLYGYSVANVAGRGTQPLTVSVGAVSISSHSIMFPVPAGTTTVSIPSGSVSGLSNDTDYSVFYNPNSSTFHVVGAASAPAFFASVDNYIWIGDFRTPSGGGTWTAPTSDFTSNGLYAEFECVSTEAYLPGGKKAGEVERGDTLVQLAANGDSAFKGTVSAIKRSTAKCLTITTTRGARLTVSGTAPIMTRLSPRHMPYSLPAKDVLIGLDVPILVDDTLFWDYIESVVDVGLREVARITCSKVGIFAASDNEVGPFLFTHNSYSKP